MFHLVEPLTCLRGTGGMMADGIINYWEKILSQCNFVAHKFCMGCAYFKGKLMFITEYYL
jgi:hypothetical protein